MVVVVAVSSRDVPPHHHRVVARSTEPRSVRRAVGSSTESTRHSRGRVGFLHLESVRAAREGSVVHAASRGEVRDRNSIGRLNPPPPSSDTHRKAHALASPFDRSPPCTVRPHMNPQPSSSRFGLALAGGMLSALLLAEVATARQQPGSEQMLSSWRTERSAIPLDVIAAAAVEVDGRLHLLGGLDDRFEATAVIQTRSPRDGWRPIGDRLDRPRADASAVRLPKRRILILGGFEGPMSQPAWHDDGELLDPEIAGSTVGLPSFGGSLEGHTATPLADGTVLVVAGDIARRLDPEVAPEAMWGPAIRLPESRRGHAAIRLDDRRVLVVCGVESASESTPALRIIEVTEDRRGATVLDGLQSRAADLPAGLRETSIARDPTSGELLVVGGFDPSRRRTTGNTWWIDPQREEVRAGLPLPVEHGAARVHLAETESGVAMLGGEWRTRTARGEVDLSVLAAGGAATDRRRRLAPLPVSGTRRMRIQTPGIELIGGYRYRSPEEASATGLPAGVHFDTRSYRLSLVPAGRGD